MYLMFIEQLLKTVFLELQLRTFDKLYFFPTLPYLINNNCIIAIIRLKTIMPHIGVRRVVTKNLKFLLRITIRCHTNANIFVIGTFVYIFSHDGKWI